MLFMRVYVLQRLGYCSKRTELNNAAVTGIGDSETLSELLRKTALLLVMTNLAPRYFRLLGPKYFKRSVFMFVYWKRYYGNRASALSVNERAVYFTGI